MSQYEVLKSYSTRTDADARAKILEDGGLKPLVVDREQAAELGLEPPQRFAVLIEADDLAAAEALFEKSPTPSAEANRMLRQALLLVWILTFLGISPMFLFHLGGTWGTVGILGFLFVTLVIDALWFGFLLRRVWKEPIFPFRKQTPTESS
ncbi:MAG: hypothetical protein RL885_28480 [Planctomycetota bacterium]